VSRSWVGDGMQQVFDTEKATKDSGEQLLNAGQKRFVNTMEKVGVFSPALSAELKGWTTKDSGEREEFEGGMIRDIQQGKPRFDLLIPLDLPYEKTTLYRWAMLMARGAEKYGDRNWEKAKDAVARARAKGSAFRHFMQWFCGQTDEDHAAAVFFNITEVEYIDTKERLGL